MEYEIKRITKNTRFLPNNRSSIKSVNANAKAPERVSAIITSENQMVIVFKPNFMNDYLSVKLKSHTVMMWL